MSSLGDKKSNVVRPVGCFTIALATVLIIGMGMGIMLAKSGLVDIPILTKVYYHKRAPERVIVLHNQESIEELVQEKLAPVLRAAQQADPDEQATIRIREEEATALLRVRLDERGTGRLKNPQIVFHEGEIEVYTETKGNNDVSYMIRFEPLLHDDSSISAHISHLSVGNIVIPGRIAERVLESALKSRMESIRAVLSSSGIKQVRAQEAFLEIDVNVAQFSRYIESMSDSNSLFRNTPSHDDPNVLIPPWDACLEAMNVSCVRSYALLSAMGGRAG